MTEYQFIADDEENKQPQEIVVLDTYKVEENKKTYNIELLGYMGQGRACLINAEGKLVERK